MMKTAFELFPVILIGLGYPALAALKLKPLTKKKAIRIFLIFWGVCFSSTLFFLLPTKDLPIIIFPLAFICIGVFVLIKETRVCPECGYTVIPSRFSAELKVCPKCKAEYDPDDIW
jgi:hypothetical protein